MKNWMLVSLAVALMGWSGGAYACPELTGTFECASDGEVYRQTVTQELLRGHMVYTVTQENRRIEIITDGQEHPFEGIDELQNATYVASCAGDVASATLVGDIMDNGTVFAVLNAELSFKINADNNLVSHMEGTYTSDLIGEIPFEQTINCFRQ